MITMPGLRSINYPRGTARAVARSLRIYHGDAARRITMDRFYRTLVEPGALAFDIGAHVGDRVSCFRRLGAKVVALEPQPGLARAIRLIHGRDPDVTLIEACCSDRVGSVSLRINSNNPTVSSASAAFIAAASRASGWEDQMWDGELRVPCTTLDELIATHGLPRFIKIDVEGLEAQVLAGLSQQVATISFEFTTLQRDVAKTCIETLHRLGPYRFNMVQGESLAFALPKPVGSADAIAYLDSLPASANSGDVYAGLTI